MMDQDSVRATTSEVGRLAVHCAEADDAEACERLYLAVGTLESAVREHFQALLRRDFTVIADKLDAGDPLDPEERATLKQLLTGVSRHYVESENDVDSWRAEIRRLGEELREASEAGELGIDALIRIQSLCREAVRVVPDLRHYLSERGRLARFDESLASLDPGEAKMLARVVRDMMVSARR